jgi:hypothetical protein
MVMVWRGKMNRNIRARESKREGTGQQLKTFRYYIEDNQGEAPL